MVALAGDAVSGPFVGYLIENGFGYQRLTEVLIGFVQIQYDFTEIVSEFNHSLAIFEKLFSFFNFSETGTES